MLIQPGDENLTTVVTINIKDFLDDIRKHIKCRCIQEHFPFPRRIFFDKDHIYDFRLYIDEEGGPLVGNREYNACATITADPLGEFLGKHIYGPAIMVAKKKKNLSLDDWKKIKQATWYDKKLVEINVNQEFQ